MADDTLGVRRVAPVPGSDHGTVTCVTCGQGWTTTPDQDHLLAEMFAHLASHGAAPGQAPTSADPHISTR